MLPLFLGREMGPARRCSACSVVVDEISAALEKEVPQQDLDLRKLNSRGGREGKLIGWQVSELRTIEVLEGICQGMEQYDLDDKLDQYQKMGDVKDGVLDFGNIEIGGGGGGFNLGGLDMLRKSKTAGGRAERLQLKRYCEWLLEEHEEAFIAMVQKGGDFKESLCVETAKLCGKKADKKAAEEKASAQSVHVQRIMARKKQQQPPTNQEAKISRKSICETYLV